MTYPTPPTDLWPSRGLCAFCGQHDANHRVIDAVAEQVRAEQGFTVDEAAEEFGVSIEAAQWAVDNGPDYGDYDGPDDEYLDEYAD